MANVVYPDYIHTTPDILYKTYFLAAVK